MDIGPLLPLVRRWWWTLLVAAWSAGLIGYVVAARIPPTYAATTTLLVGPINTDNETLRASSQLVATYAELAGSDAVLRSVGEAVGLDLEGGSGVPTVRATGSDTTRLLEIRAELGDPEAAARAAQGVADHLLALSVQDVTRPEGELRVVDPALADPVPIAPNTSLLILLAAAAGLIAAALLALLLETLSPAVRTDAEAARLADAPLLGTIDDAGASRRRGRDPAGLPRMHPVYGLIGARLLARGQAQRLLVTAAGPREGTGEVALDLARAIAATGRDVTIVVADPAAPPLAATVAGSGGEPSLVTSSDVVQPTRFETLPLVDVPHVRIALQRGEQDHDPADVLAHAAAGGRVVIVDAGPADGSTSALRWAEAVDAAILVVRRGRTDRDALAAAADALRVAGVPNIGLVVLGFPARRRLTPTAALVGRPGVDAGTSAVARFADRPDRHERAGGPSSVPSSVPATVVPGGPGPGSDLLASTPMGQSIREPGPPARPRHVRASGPADVE